MPAKRIPRHETGVYYGWVLPMAWKWALKKLQWSSFKTCGHWLPFQNICTSSYVLQLTSSVPQSPTLRRLRPPLAWRLSEPIWRHGVKLMAAKFKLHWLNDHTTNCNQDHQDQGSADQPGKSRNFQGRIGIPKFWNAPTQKADLGRQWCIIHRSSRSAPRTSQWVALKVKLASRFFCLVVLETFTFSWNPKSFQNV